MIVWFIKYEFTKPIQLEEAMALLQSLDELDGQSCGQQFLIYAVFQLNTPMVWETRGAADILLTTAACRVSKYMLTFDLGRFLYYCTVYFHV